MCRPALSLESIADIDLIALRKRGIRLLFCDLDNTLLRWKAENFSTEAAAFASAVRDSGFELCILSNSSNGERVRSIAEALCINGIARAGKPLPFAIKRELVRRHCPPEQAALIGDQLLTDMLTARLAGVMGILVQPIDPNWEHMSTRINRILEKPLRRLYKIHTGDGYR